MPTRRDNDAERFARIEALMEEYRIKHEDLKAYVDEMRQRTERTRQESHAIVDFAKEVMKRRKVR